jgi:transcriptional regulator with XRE-family HTH domain
MEEKPHIRNIIAKNVRKYRKLNLLTQEELAEAAEVSNTYIANIECGQTWISDKTLEKIANALHLEEYLLFIPETEISSNTIDDRQKMIEYLKSREKEIGDYVKEFFSATFDKILEDK